MMFIIYYISLFPEILNFIYIYNIYYIYIYVIYIYIYNVFGFTVLPDNKETKLGSSNQATMRPLH